MITFTANIRSASARSDDAITTSSVGIPVKLVLADEFNGLAKTLIFRAGATTVDVVLVGDATEAVVPPDVLTTVGLWLGIGIYGADGEGNVVIPTVWASAGLIQQGTVPSGVDPADPTPNWVAQVQEIASDAMETAQSVRTDADNGEFDGYSPTVTVTNIPGGHQVTITDEDGNHTFNVMDGTSGEEVFIATYGTTTNAEIKAAIDAGKACFAVYDNYFLPLSQGITGNGTAHYFGGINAGNARWVYCLNNSWYNASRVVPEASSATPKALGTASAGTSSDYSRADHVHTKPTYTKSNVGLGNVANERQYSANNPPPYPVTSVNGETGAVVLDASDVGAVPSGQGIPASGTTGQVLKKKSNTDYDVEWANESGGGSGAVDSVNGQTGTVVLDAADVGALPDTTTIPTKTSQLQNDSGFLTSAPVTSVNGQTGAVTVSVPSASSATPQALGTASAGSSSDFSRADHVHAKPTYSKSDVGLGNVDNVQQYSASNPPPYPVTSVNGSTGAVTLSIPSSASDVGAVASNQGSGNAGKFLVVGNDGVVTPVTMTAWAGGSF